MYSQLRYFKSLLIASCCLTTVLGLSTTFPASPHAQCSDFTIAFEGSTAVAPFTLLLIPPSSSTPQVISIPDSAWDAATGKGSYSTRVPFPSGTQFVAVLEDAKGRGTGIVSSLFSVSSSEDASCLGSASPSANIFTLSPSPPSQCVIQTISWNLPTALQNQEEDLAQFVSNNLNITGYIPSGSAFTLDVAAGGAVGSDSQAIWSVDITSGLDYIFLYEYIDVNGNMMLETSPVQTVGAPLNGAGDCIRPESPNVTASAAEATDISSKTATAQTTALPSTAAVPTSASSKNKPMSRTVVILAVIGSVLGVCGTAGLIFMLLWRRRKTRLDNEEDALPPSSPSAQWATFGDDREFRPLSLHPGTPLGIPLPPAARQSNYGKSTVHFADERKNERQHATPSPASKRTILGRAKASKKATLSMSSWGNRGSLASTVRASQYGGLSRGPSDASSHGAERMPSPYAPPSSQGHSTEYDEEGNLQPRIRYLDLDNNPRQYGYAL